MSLYIWGEDGRRTVHAVGQVLAEAADLGRIPICDSPKEFAGNHVQARRNQVAFARFLADRLAEGAFVIVYVDGDEAWSSRNPDAPRCRVLGALLRNAAQVLHDQGIPARGRAVAVMPYWEVESWLYQNFEALVRSFPELADVQDFVAAYRLRRSEIDDIVRIKQRFGDSANDRLAFGFPVQDVLAAGASFASAVLAIRAACTLWARGEGTLPA